MKIAELIASYYDVENPFDTDEFTRALEEHEKDVIYSYLVEYEGKYCLYFTEKVIFKDGSALLITEHIHGMLEVQTYR